MNGPDLSKARPRLATTLGWFTALNVLRSGVGLILLPLYLRYLPPEQYGMLAVLTAAAAIFGLVANLKLDASLRTFYFDHDPGSAALENYVRKILSAAFYSAFVLFGMALVFGPLIFGAVFAHEELQFFPAGAVACGASAAGACLSSYFVYLRNSLRLLELSLWQGAIIAGTLTLQLLLVAGFSLGILGVLWGLLLPQLAALIVLVCKNPRLLRTPPFGRHLAASLRYSLPLLGIAICYALGSRLDRLVLEHYVTLETLATYAVLATLLGLLALVLDSLDNTIRPHLYPSMRSGDSRDAIRQYQTLYVCAGLLALAFAAFVGSQVSLVTQRLAYTDLLQWLPLGATALAPTILSRYYALLFEYHKQSVALAALSLSRLVTRALLLLWWVPQFGIGGLLAALLVAEILNAIAFAGAARRRFGASSLLSPLVVVQFGSFAAIIWLVAYAVPSELATAGGVLQLVGISLVLVALNYRPLRQLARPPSADVSNLEQLPRSNQA